MDGGRSIVLWVALFLSGCGGCDQGGEVVPGDAASVDTASPSTTCEGDDECPAGQVCDTTRMVCIGQGTPCESNDDCPDGAFCDLSAAELGMCRTGGMGAPCESDQDCAGGTCTDGMCGCAAITTERELAGGPLDVFLIFDRTGSMGDDCEYVPGSSPPVSSKACFATYALPDYLINVSPMVDTRLAFQFMSLDDDDCDGSLYATPLIPLTTLPVSADHAIITAISDETFEGGFGTHIEGALRGIAQFTSANETPGREMIGVLITDGDPRGCQEDLDDLSTIVSDHLSATGLRTFIIGMEGATEANLEQLAMAGGADPHDDFCGGVGPPCHYWNVGDGSGDAIASALQAIIQMSVPLPCQFDVLDLMPPPGETIDFGQLNVTLTEGDTTTTIGQVPSEDACPGDQPAWYYDNPSAPTQIHLCPTACDQVSSAGDGARIDVVVGCMDTVVII